MKKRNWDPDKTYYLPLEQSTRDERRQIHKLFEKHGYSVGGSYEGRDILNSWNYDFVLTKQHTWMASTVVGDHWIPKTAPWWIGQIVLRGGYEEPVEKYIDISPISPKDTFLDQQLKTFKNK